MAPFPERDIDIASAWMRGLFEDADELSSGAQFVDERAFRLPNGGIAKELRDGLERRRLLVPLSKAVERRGPMFEGWTRVDEELSRWCTQFLVERSQSGLNRTSTSTGADTSADDADHPEEPAHLGVAGAEMEQDTVDQH